MTTADKFTIKNGNNNATWSLTPQSGHDNAFLVCGHISTNFDNNKYNLKQVNFHFKKKGRD